MQGCESWAGGLLPLMAESGRQRHYGHHLHYCTSLSTCLARLASLLPKRMLKASLEEFFDTIFYTLGGFSYRDFKFDDLYIQYINLLVFYPAGVGSIG
jgi:hypothetical protein